MEDKDRRERIRRIAPHLKTLRTKQEPDIMNKQQLLSLMQDLKDEGNTLFKEEKFMEAWEHYCFALFSARQLERKFYSQVDKDFLATLFCNASLCCLKTGHYEEALKDADMALCCQPNHIKAMYRRAVALKELGQYQEALEQAKKGRALDHKDIFDLLIDEIKQLLPKPTKGGKNKGDKSTVSSEVNSEWTEDTNAVINEKKKKMSSKNAKKKKGQPQAQAQAQAHPTRIQASAATKKMEEDEEIDSDSTNSDDNDEKFTEKFQEVRGRHTKNKTANNPPQFAQNNLKTQTDNNTKSDDGFTTAKSKTSQQNRKQSISLQWPYEGYVFRLVCRFCFVKEKEGPGGHKFKENHPHSCSHDILIVRDKGRPHLDWLKIRPRPNVEGSLYTFKYKMCNHFQNSVPCRTGELNCTFAHNHAEATLWSLDRDRVFNIQGFINDAKKQGIISSDILNAAKPTDSGNERYIPGLTGEYAGARRQPSPQRATTSPTSQAQQYQQFFTAYNNNPTYQTRPPGASVGGMPPPTATNTCEPSNFQQQSAQFYKPSEPYPYYEAPEIRRQTSQPGYNMPRPMAQPPPIIKQNIPSFQQPPPPVFKPPLLPTFTQPSPPKFNQPMPPNASNPFFSNPMPNLSQPPPTHRKIENPFPKYKFQLFCPLCLKFSGRPWYYLQHNISHQCLQNILAYFVQDDHQQNCWVQVRERATHRSFKGNYILCSSVKNGNTESCKFKETCSFAHNVIEQNMWKLEQEGKFDVSEFIFQNKKHSTSSDFSSSKIHVIHLLEKFGGYFRFICRNCFFSHRPMISSKGAGNFCSGAAHHQWDICRIVAHVKNTTYTPIDERKFVHAGAFYLMCKFMHYCRHWLENKCRYAHSQVEKEVWMLERDTAISRDELVTQSASLFQKQPQGNPQAPSGSGAWVPRGSESSRPSTPAAEPQVEGPSINLAEFCRTCWGKGQRSKEDVKKDKCVRGHSNFKVNSVFVSLPAGKEIKSLQLRPGMKPVLCTNYPKCTRAVCTHPHSQEELEVWSYMLKHQIKTLRELCEHLQEVQKNKTRKINIGESVINVLGQTTNQSKSVNQIIAPGDLMINEHYCSYCGISCNSARQWDDHCISEKHINNVNSDKEHQWNFRQPPWGQGSNLALCAKHLHNQSCQYSHVPDMYNLCKYAHSQEELDEWLERYEWRQLKRQVAKERHMFSYTEDLLEEYYSKDNSVNVISESLADVSITCNEEQVLYKIEKNAVFTWVFEIHTHKTIEKVALLHNKDRLHFSLVGSDDTRHQIASGDQFLAVDHHGHACYKVNVCFSGGMFGSFSQWVVFDFGERPVLVRKLAVEIGDHLQHERVKDLREDLLFDRWTSLNREIQRAPDDTLDDFTIQLLNKYKEPAASEDVVTMDSLTELNRHNYVHKMHKLLELEEITRHAIIARYNLISEVTASKTAIVPESGILLNTPNGMFIKVTLSEYLTEDTWAGKLLLDSVRAVLLAPTSSRTNKIYEAVIVGENNFGFDCRGKEYIYLFVDATTAGALGLSTDKAQVELEIQFQMDRKLFCRMHYALDSLQTNDVIFPDVVRFKPDINQYTLKIRSNVLNEDQMTAVRHIVAVRDGYTPPFIMYGPFGTGKTETLAQATMTLLKERADVRILICTQSNSAADLYITKHLDNFFKKHKGKLNMLRLNAEERKLASIPPEVKDYSYFPNGIKIEYPEKDYIKSYNVVVTTVENSMQLTKLGLYNFFTHIFIDEAGQILECEILMPLTLATSKTCVVLTGDHHQIGPMVYSQEARRQKLDMSILVRLYNYYEQIANCGMSQVAEKSQQSPLNIFLSINYRTKPEILRFISSVFYGGPDNLKAYGQVPAVMGLTPLMFYAVQGTETQNEDMTSYINHAEAQEVLERVKELLDNWPKEWGDVNANKIAVITCYSDQVKHIRDVFRRDRSRPELGKVDIGPIHSFQGKEVRALFISTVRTTHLLEEAHIIRSLEAGNDIGDLGFLSNPKMLNTALTRTQSFVGVVGDPIALCLIGECIQVWRTYLKHCTNMKSVRPRDLTYDFVRNQVVNIQVGPSGRVVDMITKRSQDNFKQSLQGKSVKARQATRRSEEIPTSAKHAGNKESFMYAPGAEGGDIPYGWMAPGNLDQPLPTVKSSITPENRQRLKQARQFGHEKLSLSLNISCEDIIFQLAKENLPAGKANETSLIKSEGINISEIGKFAVLMYNSHGTNISGPYTIKSEDDDFNAFVLHDEDNAKTPKIYENFSIDTLNTKLEDDPEQFVKCTFHVEGDRAFASVSGPLPAQLQGLGWMGHEIEIIGQLNRGHAFNGDVVVVQLVGRLEDGRLEGQVKGILERALDPNNRLFVCTADSENTGILTPINPDVPRIYCLTSAARIKLARKGNVCVYKFVSSSCIEFSHYEHIDPADNASRLFIVRYLTWEPGFFLPLGVVVGMLNLDGSLDKGMQVLEIEHNIKRELRPQAIDEADLLFPQNFSLPADMLQNRRNLTQNFCFTISSPEAEDLEMAISVSQVDSNYEVGIHVTDVVAYVDKDSVLDQECEHRGGASLFPLGRDPKHMLPSQMCRDFCSLKPDFDRLAISVIIYVNEQGQVLGEPEVFRSVINSKQRFSHSEVEEIVLNTEESLSDNDYLKSCIVVLYQLTYAWRCERLGNSQVFPDLDPGKHLFLHSHLMLNEVKIYFNAVIAKLLLARFEETTPLLVQPAPEAERLDEWKKDYACHAFNSIPMTRAFLEDKVCQCNRACTCVFSYMRKHHLKNGDYLTMLKDRWLMVSKAVDPESMDFELVQDLISNPENMPQIAIAYHKLKAIYQPEKYVCSQDTAEHERKHYSLCVSAYTNSTSPLRRFICMVVQRLLVAYIEGTASPYSSVEIEDICAQATATEKDVDKFDQAVFVMHLANALKARQSSFNALVEEVKQEKVVMRFEGISGLSRDQRTILLSLLSPAQVTGGKEEMKGTVELLWEERVYQHAAVKYSEVQNSSLLKLEPDRFVCNISSLQWQRLLIAAREKDEAAMTSCVQEISKHIGGEVELLSKSYPEVLSDVGRDGSGRHFVPFSFTLHQSQVLRVQLSVQVNQGLLVPSVQLLSLTPCLDVCLEHKTDPSNCFANSSLAKQAEATYADEVKYTSDWLLPVLALESAYCAVNDGDRVTIHSVHISWRTDRNVLTGDVIEGSFLLSDEFCFRSSFQPDLVSSLLDGRPLPSNDPTFSMDYVCVRCSFPSSPLEPALHDSVMMLVNNDRPITWVGHCRVTGVTKSAGGYTVKVLIVKSSMKIPEDLLDDQVTAGYTVEWIRKTLEHRVTDVAIRGLQNASSFAKEIVIGKKPNNAVVPIDQDNSIFKNHMSEEQEAVIAESYRQPFTVILGGPGTGKSQLAARLAHLMVGRNRKADAIRQVRGDGYTSQLMICAPNEKSLDVITENLINLNFTKVNIVRVYSEEIEERDFPISSSPKPSITARPPSDCIVMKEVALHHLIRGKDNAESKCLLEQEMMTTYGKQMATAVDASIRKAQTIELKKAQIILCTCITSARSILKQTVNIKQIIIDDAGFISEAEVIVPLVMHRGVNQLVLLGDLEMPQSQVKDPSAKLYGLSRSLLHRYSERAQKLSEQYRCPAILCSFSSSQFYNSQLNTSSKAYQQSPAPTILWPGGAGFPCVFLHVAGQESVPERLQGRCLIEDDIINTEEFQTVIVLVNALTQKHKINSKSILILTNTSAQAALIRDQLPRGFTVSTIMDSIGREAEYVILSTVRALPESGLQLPPTSKWTKAHLGRLANPRVVNLAITRAKTAIFVFGNKDLLTSCEPWKTFLATYRGKRSVQTDARDFIQSLLLMS